VARLRVFGSCEGTGVLSYLMHLSALDFGVATVVGVAVD